ncbi:AtpZ/AtpI family protein [Thermosporothrix hazakensis]|uniref:AtpZ/AtpI family protein n=1 Tax=Thermosporothrix hazakensis TaxID=644383 RepID=UPI001472E95F|nr:AtpZ/AtpI family protein [Thermosporothrix hazakensis]
MLVGQLGFTIAIPIALLALLGYWVDGRFHTAPLFILLGLLLGLISGIFGAYRLLKTAGIFRSYEKKKDR